MATTQGIKLDDETQKRLKALAIKRDRSPHWLMRTAIETYLNHEEQYELEKSEDLRRWQQYELTNEAVDHSKAAILLEQLAHGQTDLWQQ